MLIKREILLKAIVTNKLKANLTEAVQNTINRLGEEQEEMERQYRRLMLEVQRMDASRAMSVLTISSGSTRAAVSSNREERHS